MKYEVLRHVDIWGNEQDGWEVNDSSLVGFVILPNPDDDSSIIRALKTAGIVTPATTEAMINIHDDAEMIFLDDAKTGKPIFTLWAIYD